jgi:hypothetical protein
MAKNIEHFPVFIGHLYYFFWELHVQFTCPFINWIICFLSFFFSALCILDISVLLDE